MRPIAWLLGLVGWSLIAPVIPALQESATAHAQISHNCSFCHDLHGGSFSALREFDVVEDLCWSCHSDAGPAQVDRDGVWVDVPKGPFEVHNGARHTEFGRAATGCWDCHDHEGETAANLSMIREMMTTPVSGDLPVSFTSRGTDAGQPSLHSFADGDEDGDGDYDGVCEACHTETSNHQNGLNLPDVSDHTHEVGRTCTDCHTHESGFAGGGPCGSCHDTGGQGTSGPNSRRPIVPEMSWASNHVGASYVDGDCLVCHEFSAHQAGNVRLKNADDSTTVYILTGDPQTQSAEAAKLEAFCVSCHDLDGANGTLAPFSDGLTRPLIDASAWTTASHKQSAAIVGCFGDGSFGCHASHGSQKARILAPGDVAPDPTTRTEEEEGFCLDCHDSDGPATTDLATGFARAINWVQTATGLGSNANLNDRHDIQQPAQARSGAKIECTNCHNPHTLTAAQKYLIDPDPSDGHIPGTDWYFTAYQSAGDILSEFCLDCHDGSFPSSVQDQTTAITNIRTTWVNDGMGVRTGSSVDLRAGIGWGIGDVMPCWSCHSNHVIIDQSAGIGTTTLFRVLDQTLGMAPDDTALAFWDRKGAAEWEYGITNNLDKADLTSGGWWCNTCHDRSSMTGKENCYNCHRHGDGGRF
jgi:predicted CXXCH cytochrome family protein